MTTGTRRNVTDIETAETTRSVTVEAPRYAAGCSAPLTVVGNSFAAETDRVAATANVTIADRR
ncbi:MAG: hypothetical protein ABEJ08_05790 [Halobacteriaceae archaeon]